MQKVNCERCPNAATNQGMCDTCQFIFGLSSALGRVVYGGMLLARIQHLVTHHTDDPREEKDASFAMLECLKEKAEEHVFVIANRIREIEHGEQVITRIRTPQYVM